MHIQTGATTSTMTSTAAYPGLPASPTLTNPDMILPYGEYSGSDSPPQKTYAGTDDWEIGSAANMQFSIGSAHSGLGPLTPTTPIIYGNGTMLSDIGEVTEAESVVGRSRRLPGPAERRMLKQRQNSPLRSSPTLGQDAVMKRAKAAAHQRKMSVESASTVRSEGQSAELFKDFDDSASVDDSVFQGDDEESVADSYTEEIIASETQRLSKVDDDEDADGNSSAALSRRAEEILLNAKKRLNNMEGNLTRARTSLSIHPVASNSSIHSSSPLSRSTPSPTTNGKLIPLQLGLPPSKRQLHSTPDTSNASPGHSRVYSEDAVRSNQFTSPNLIRSASAAARYGSSKYSPESSRESGVRSALASPLNRTNTPLSHKLEPLTEDEPARIERSRNSDRSSSSSGDNHLGLTRSTSSMQMRDLKDQMHDLKGRLSVLRDRARDDTMKRRSLQSLRTPSPFTAAEQWYAGAQGYGEGNLSSDAVVTYAPWQQSPITPKSGEMKLPSPTKVLTQQPEYPESDATSVYEDVSEGVGSRESGEMAIVIPDNTPYKSDNSDETDIQYETAPKGNLQKEVFVQDEDYQDDLVEAEDYESDASLYHDSFPISHEDREDAFDYEHFFLHSAMGTISQQRHGRRGSYSSEDSVETTRGPTSTNTEIVDERTALGHLRNNSNASVSTLATFATATEGYEDDDDDDHDNFAVQEVVIPARSADANSPPTTAKRSTFGSPINNILAEAEKNNRPISVLHNGQPLHSSDHVVSKPTRSIPLVNKPKSQQVNGADELRTSPVDMLHSDDQMLVESVVAAVGKCVLGLQEAGPSSYEAKAWRRRLDAARRILESEESPP